MPKCILLVGVPASGKSTFVHALTGMYEVMSTDDIIQSCASKYDMTYDQAFNDLIKFAETVFWNKINKAGFDGAHMVIDRTNLSIKSRKKIIDLLSKQGYEFEAYVFPTPDPVEWDRRLNSRPGKTIPKNVLTSMKSSLTMPTVDEGFSLIRIIE